MTQPMPTLPGIPEQIARYQLLSELGRGSMGHVYLALDPNIDRKVALKIFVPLLKVGAAEQWELRQRFVFEARAAGQLNHPGIVTIFDADTDPDTGLSYLAMEWVNGPSLDDLIRESGPLSIERSMSIVEQVAVALDAAHHQGLVHRDIKPANILLENSGRAKVTDFGIAKLASMSITTTGWIPGSPFYMSPEQIRNEGIDRRSDLYALGAVLYQCLTGALPFEAESLAALTHMILEIDPRPVRSVNPKVSADLAAVIDQALAKSPDDRFDSGREFAAALQLARVGKFRAATRGSISAVARQEAVRDLTGDLGGLGGTGTIGIAKGFADAGEIGESLAGSTAGEAAPSEQVSGATPVAVVEDEQRVAPAVPVGGEPAATSSSPVESGSGAVYSVPVEVEPDSMRSASVEEVEATGDRAGSTAARPIALAAGIVLALVAVWSLRPVQSESSSASPTTAELLSLAPRYSADASSGVGGFAMPAEPPEMAEPSAAPEPIEPAVPSAGGASTNRQPRPVGAISRPRTPVPVAAATTPPGPDPTTSGDSAVGPGAADADASAGPTGHGRAVVPQSVPVVRATSKLEVVYRNRFKNAAVSISIDGNQVYASNVATPRGLIHRTVGKNVWTSLDLTPGEHFVDVRVTGAEGKIDLVRRASTTFEDGRIHRLRVSVTPLKKLKLTWKESPVG